MTGREELVARWLELTRVILPGMAATAGWPIALDHCFMRVFLDHAMGQRWDATVKRPAIRHMPADAFQRAVALAELVIIEPTRLPALNARSLEWRRVQRRVRAGAGAGAGGTRGGA